MLLVRFAERRLVWGLGINLAVVVVSSTLLGLAHMKLLLFVVIVVFELVRVQRELYLVKLGGRIDLGRHLQSPLVLLFTSVDQLFLARGAIKAL